MGSFVRHPCHSLLSQMVLASPVSFVIITNDEIERSIRRAMATPGQLMEVVGECLGMSVASVVGYDRYLADAGLRTKGGRGKSAVQVTARDAAHLLVAILGGGQVKDAVATVQRYAQTVPHSETSSKRGFKPLRFDELASLPDSHSFIDALEAIITAATNGSLRAAAQSQQKGRAEPAAKAPLIELAALTPGTVGNVRVSDGHGKSAEIRYALLNPFSSNSKASRKEMTAWQSRIKVRTQSDLEQFRKVSERTVWAIGRALAAS